jgi:hypothetical protein
MCGRRHRDLAVLVGFRINSPRRVRPLLLTGILLLLLSAVSGCGGSSTQPNSDGQVRVTGTILDFQTGAPVGAARVAIDGATVTADSSGVYSLTVPSGEQQVSIDGESIGTITMKDPTYRGDLYAHVTGCIARYGTVVDSQTRRPVSNAVVSINGQLVVATDGTGWFRENLGCPGTQCVGFNTTLLSITHPNYVTGSFVIGLGVCRVERVDYELASR